MDSLVIEDFKKSYGDVVAVSGVDISVRSGEFFSILGPSGSGKTTLLRAIAGFVTPTSGRILLGGEDVSHTPPNRRQCNLVFQSYALFPHMSVADNVAFGLVERKVRKAEIQVRVRAMLELTQLDQLAKRRPTQLSGGQQQRVALARALVLDPVVLLLDEPLGALDAKLRRTMQEELKRIQHEVGTTFVYVTHDQDEALRMSNRIAVMNEGRVEQIGTPLEIYDAPMTPFVAGFVGEGALLDGQVASSDGDEVRIELVEGGVAAVAGQQTSWTRGERCKLLLRPESVRLGPAAAAEAVNRLDGHVTSQTFEGAASRYHVSIADGRVVDVLGRPDPGVTVGTPVSLQWSSEDARLVRVAGSQA